jgi:hypothetical protein
MELNPALFAGSIPVEKKITLRLDDGTTVDQLFYIREMSALDMRRQVLSERSEDPSRVEMALSRLIASAVCDADGQVVMTEKQAGSLKPLVAGQLRDLIMEVNGMGKAQGVTEPTPE